MIFSSSKSRKTIALLLSVIMVFTCFSVLPNDVDAAVKDTPGSAKTQFDQESDNPADLLDKVFYVAVKESSGSDIKYYYYSLDEIKAYSDQYTYDYTTHEVDELVTAKGAMLYKMIDDINKNNDVEITDDMKVQYAMRDGWTPGYNHEIRALYPDKVAKPVHSIIAYSGKCNYGKDASKYNQNDKDYVSFDDYASEDNSSVLRAYLDLGSAGSGNKKKIMGVIISEDGDLYKADAGFYQEYYNSDLNEPVDVSEDQLSYYKGLLPGMYWPAQARTLPYLNISNSQITSDAVTGYNSTYKTKVVIAGGFTTENKVSTFENKVRFNYTEKEFMYINQNGVKKIYKHSDLTQNKFTYPQSGLNPRDGQTYDMYGFEKPMYYRFVGSWLENKIDAPKAGEKIYLVKEDGSVTDITDKSENFFIAYQYTHSRGVKNQAEDKRYTVNYPKAVLLDMSTAKIEYGNDNTDGVPISAKSPTQYNNANIIVTSETGIPVGLSAKSSAHNKVNVEWKAVSGSTEYEVYKAAGKSGFTKITDTKTTKLTDTNVNTGTTYTYKVKAYKTIGDVKIYSKDSVTVTAKPVLKKAAVKAKKTGKRKAVIRWNKIAGAKGYEVFRAAKKKGKYKKIKTIKKNKTVKFTNKKLKKGKRYYFKVRGYKVINGKKIYGSFSKIKSVKI